MTTKEMIVANNAKQDYLALLAQSKTNLSAARERWVDTYPDAIKSVQTLEDAIRVYFEAPRGTAKDVAFCKWVELCTTFQQLHKAVRASRYRFPLRLYAPDSDNTWEVENPAIEKYRWMIKEVLAGNPTLKKLKSINTWWVGIRVDKLREEIWTRIRVHKSKD